MDRRHHGLVQSMVIEEQRRLLDEIGHAVGTPVVYLKAAWADPVLYGGRGERVGSDVDVLVRPAAFAAVGHALEARGFRRSSVPWSRASNRWGHKAWVYQGPPPGLGIDLHRGLADPHWFDLPPDECLDRAVAYDGAAGPVLSLGPEDQILYAAVHYANHRFGIDQRHIADVARLVAARPIDWEAVDERARRYGLRLPLALLLEALHARGAPVPVVPSGQNTVLAWRLAFARRWVETAPALRRRPPQARFVDIGLRLPLLSDRATALPRYVASFALWRTLDVGGEVAARVAARLGAGSRRQSPDAIRSPGGPGAARTWTSRPPGAGPWRPTDGRRPGAG
jgi:hypothetical protein